jgi:hypothetical protein
MAIAYCASFSTKQHERQAAHLEVGQSEIALKTGDL